MINIVYHGFYIIIIIIIIILSNYPINFFFFFLFHWEAKPRALLVRSDLAGMLYQYQKEKGFFLLPWIFCKFQLSLGEQQGIPDLPRRLH